MNKRLELKQWERDQSLDNEQEVGADTIGKRLQLRR